MGPPGTPNSCSPCWTASSALILAYCVLRYKISIVIRMKFKDYTNEYEIKILIYFGKI